MRAMTSPELPQGALKRRLDPHPEQGFRTCLGVLRLYRGLDPSGGSPGSSVGSDPAARLSAPWSRALACVRPGDAPEARSEDLPVWGYP
jgi:hypothetical protein